MVRILGMAQSGVTDSGKNRTHFAYSSFLTDYRQPSRLFLATAESREAPDPRCMKVLLRSPKKLPAEQKHQC